MNDPRRSLPRRPGEGARLSRRQLMRSTAVAALGGAFGIGCQQFRQPPATAVVPVAALPPGGREGWAGAGGGRLARVIASGDREIRTIAGLRPFRATGFRLEVERLGDKLLVHNYGHGGGGVTLSWGTSHLAVEEALAAVSQTSLSAGWGVAANGDAPGARPGDAQACAVIGCGAVGLSTAILMQRQGWHVTIYARDLPPNTTSNVAGALWQPYSVSDPGRGSNAYRQQFVPAARWAHRYFQDMVGDYYNVRWIENYTISNAPQPRPWFEAGTEDLYPEARALTVEEHPFPTTHAIAYQTMLIEPHGYLNAVLNDFRIASGRIVVRELVDRDDITTLPEPLIFNCSGLGAAKLVDDAEMDPIKGQLTFLLPQPEVNYTVIGGGLYMFPRTDGILLGGTHDRGDWSLDTDAEVTRRIVQGHRELFGWERAPIGSDGPHGC